MRRIAVVHEWLTTYAGSERVLAEILGMFPHADLFAVVDFLNDSSRAKLLGKQARTSFIQKLPFARTKYRAYLPLMPLAVEQFDLSGYDLVISSSHAVAKGVLTGPDQKHVCYCHTPIRYAWDLQHQYLREAGLRGPRGLGARIMLHYMRLWDNRTAAGVDLFLANSAYIARRIRKAYGRDARVVHPPADCQAFSFREDKEDFYLAASRMVPYKRIELIVRAFATLPDKDLLVIGDGPEFARIKALATENVTLMWYQPDYVLKDHLQRARAFIFAAEEDFGILPVEAQACGTPVIAYAAGGALETVRADATGVFFPAQTVEALRAAVARFETVPSAVWPAACRTQAERFSAARFREAFAAAIDSLEVS